MSAWKYLCPTFKMVVLAGLCLWLGLIALQHSTTEPVAVPILPIPVSARAWPIPMQSDPLLSSNPVAGAFVDAIPSSDGAEIFISVTGVGPTGSPVVLNIDSATGPGKHIDSYAMSISGTAYVATAIGFAPGQDVGSDGDNTMSITTTAGSEVVSSGEIHFQRAYVETSQPETISVDEGDFMLEMPNTDTFPDDVYVLVMSTNAAPGSLPVGCRFAGSTYNVRPSHSLTESEKLMTLNLRFVEPLPGGSDPHTLSVVGWDPANETWDVLGGDLLHAQSLLTLVTKHFRIYALATVPIWRDTFQELSLPGVSERDNTEWGPGQTIVLSNSTLSGTITSLLITSTGSTNWDTLHFSTTTSLNSGVTVDVLDLAGTVLLANVADGADLSGLSSDAYPALKLRATLTRTEATEPSPKLHAWQISWTPRVYDVCLPFVIKNGP